MIAQIIDPMYKVYKTKSVCIEYVSLDSMTCSYNAKNARSW